MKWECRAGGAPLQHDPYAEDAEQVPEDFRRHSIAVYRINDKPRLQQQKQDDSKPPAEQFPEPGAFHGGVLPFLSARNFGKTAAGISCGCPTAITRPLNASFFIVLLFFFWKMDFHS